MAKLDVAPTDYVGSLDGLVFYQRKDVNGTIVRTKCPYRAEMVKSDDRFVRTREHHSEFRGVSLMGKAIRDGLGSLYNLCRVGYVPAAVMGKLFPLLKSDPGVRGERSLRVSRDRGLFAGFELNRTIDFGTLFSGSFSVAPLGSGPLNRGAVPGDFSGGRLVVDPFDPQVALVAPTFSTHVKFGLVALCISDYHFVDGLGYVPVEVGWDGLAVSAWSQSLSLGSPLSSALTVDAAFPNLGPLPDSVTLLLSVGVVFERIAGGRAFLFPKANAGQIYGGF